MSISQVAYSGKQERLSVLAVHQPSIKEIRARKLNELRLYDSSEEVNQFCIDNTHGWWNKATRVGLMNSIAIEKGTGRSETNIWLGDTLVCFACRKGY